MNRSLFVYLIIIILSGVAVWFFVQKGSGTASISDIVGSPEPDSEAMKEDSSVGKEWVKLDNGLQIQDVVVGEGEEAKAGNAVAAHYVGTFEDGKKFDSSYDRGEPFAFMLGSGSVIKGWDIGVEGMKVGGKRKLIIPPSLAYGEAGAGGVIPPNATLYFEIELMAIQAVQ